VQYAREGTVEPYGRNAEVADEVEGDLQVPRNAFQPLALGSALDRNIHEKRLRFRAQCIDR
jgi:hypothetical protein